MEIKLKEEDNVIPRKKLNERTKNNNILKQQNIKILFTSSIGLGFKLFYKENINKKFMRGGIKTTMK